MTDTMTASRVTDSSITEQMVSARRVPQVSSTGATTGSALPTWKIILMLIAWAFVAAFMGVVTAIVGTEILRLIGVVDDNTNSYQISINVIWAVVFVVVLAVPFVFRNRFISDQAPPEA